MSKALSKSAVSFGKYLLWYAVSAALQQAIEKLGSVGIPDIYVPIAAAVLKAGATWVATRLRELEDL